MNQEILRALLKRKIETREYPNPADHDLYMHESGLDSLSPRDKRQFYVTQEKDDYDKMNSENSEFDRSRPGEEGSFRKRVPTPISYPTRNLIDYLENDDLDVNEKIRIANENQRDRDSRRFYEKINHFPEYIKNHPELKQYTSEWTSPGPIPEEQNRYSPKYKDAIDELLSDEPVMVPRFQKTKKLWLPNDKKERKRYTSEDLDE